MRSGVSLSFVFEPRQKLNANGFNERWSPDVAAELTGMCVMGLVRKFAGVDMAFVALRAPEQHWNWN